MSRSGSKSTGSQQQERDGILVDSFVVDSGDHDDPHLATAFSQYGDANDGDRSNALRMSALTALSHDEKSSQAKFKSAAVDHHRLDDLPENKVLNNLGNAPVEREAGLQILKAFQDLDRKAAIQERNKKQLTNNSLNGGDGDTNTMDDDLFMPLAEDDDDAVLRARLAQTKDEQEALEHEDTDDESADCRLSNGSSLPGKTQSIPADLTSSQRSHHQIIRPHLYPRRKHTKKTHARTESVEQAMFGFGTSTRNMMAPAATNMTGDQQSEIQAAATDLTKILSNKTHQVFESPLLSTDALIDSAEAHVHQQTALQQKKKKDLHRRANTAGRDDPDSDEEREEEHRQIIKENGDVPMQPKEPPETQSKPLQPIDEDYDGDDGDSGRNNDTIMHHIAGDKEGSIVSGYSLDSDGDDDADDNDEESGKPNSKRKFRSSRPSAVAYKMTSRMQEEMALFQQFLTPRKANAWLYIKIVTFLIVLPSLLIASLVFYLKEHPEQQAREEAVSFIIIPENENTPFISYWFIFLGVRQVVTLTLALSTQALLIDYLALGSQYSLKYFGVAATLLAVQSRGWPCVLFFWCAYNLALLSGNTPFADHWLYWQDYISLFNADCHGGGIVASDFNTKMLVTAMFITVAGAIKRVLLGLFLAQTTLSNFGARFDAVKKTMVVVGELASLAMEIQLDHTGGHQFLRSSHHSVSSMNLKTIKSTLSNFNVEPEIERMSPTGSDNFADAANTFVKQWERESEENIRPQASTDSSAKANVAPEKEGTPLHDEGLDESEEAELAALLDQWDGDEDRLGRKKKQKITIGAMMKFYKELTVMNRRYPFLPVFGRADTRDRCLMASQRLFSRLMLRSPSEKKLPFSTIAILAKDANGQMRQTKLKELVELFRPDRDMKLSKLDFIKSVDAIYKSLRQLSMNIEDSGQINKAVSFLVDGFFFGIVFCVILRQLGVDPLQLFVSLSGVILGFAFIFGGSSAKYFEGILFILVQQPYGVGDRIHLSNPTDDTSANGSSGWIVENVTLTTTTVYWGATNERATLSNGAISNLRVINAARSPKATIYVHMKFGISTHYKKIQVFRSAAEQYLKQRPREFAAMLGFRPTDVAMEQGYINYMLIAQHRDSWQKIGSILGSKANLTTYLLEVAKQLNISYISPSLPVELKFNRDASSALEAAGIHRKDAEKEH